MAFAPVNIFIAGKELKGYTSMTLTREKEKLTGSLTVEIFFTYLPKKPVMIEAAVSKEILVYIGGHLAFTGKLDSRNGKGKKSKGEDGDESSSISTSVDADSYTVTLSARGKTKYLINSSHQVKENLKDTTNKKIVEKILEPFKIDLDFKSESIDINRMRLRDGSSPLQEFRRLASENGHYFYETRDGKLRFIDDPEETMGEDLILGFNILEFSAEQSEEDSKNEITVKGQKADKKQYGSKAVTENQTVVVEASAYTFIGPQIVQSHGSGEKKDLKRRAKAEVNRRASKEKEVTLDVFHVQSRTGDPWDIGMLHYVEIPPEGVFHVMEVTKLTYTVKNDKTLKTSLTLSPKPAKGDSGKGEGLSSFGKSNSDSNATARRNSAGVTYEEGKYPSPWSSPELKFKETSDFDKEKESPSALSTLSNTTNNPPLTLSREFTQQV